MKIEINKAKFAEAISTVKEVASVGALPVIGNIKIETEGNEGVRLTATNLDQTITTRVACKVDEQGATTVNARMLSSMVGALTSAEVTFEYGSDERNRATVEGGDAKFRIATIDAKDFPKEAEIGGVKMTFKESEFKSLLRKTTYAASVDSTRRTLTGVMFCGADGSVTAVGTDGRRLASVSLAKDGVEAFEIILPQMTTRMLQRMLSGDGEVDVFIDPHKAVRFTTPRWNVQSKIIDEQYPNWRQVVPKCDMKAVTVERERFVEVLRQASIATTTDNPRVNITLTSGVMEISAWVNDASAVSMVQLPVKYDGDELDVSLNPKYVLDVLGAFDADEVRFNVLTGAHPVTITSDEADAVNVIMPLRIN